MPGQKSIYETFLVWPTVQLLNRNSYKPHTSKGGIGCCRKSKFRSSSGFCRTNTSRGRAQKVVGQIRPKAAQAAVGQTQPKAAKGAVGQTGSETTQAAV